MIAHSWRRFVASVLLGVALVGCAVVPPAGVEAPARPGAGPSAVSRSGPSDAEGPAPSTEAGATSSPHAGPSAALSPAVIDVPGGKSLADRRIPPGAGEPKGPNRTDRVVLTYDDCPHSLAAFKEFVTTAEDLGVRTVLFPLGSCTRGGTFDTDFALRHGQFVYSHSVTHREFTKLTDAQIRKELAPPAVQGTWVRPPYGASTNRVVDAVEAAGEKVWLWTLDTEDWKKLSRDQLVERVVAESQPGDTVLMHMTWNGFNADALRRMKAGLDARGIELCRTDGPATLTGRFSC